MPRDDAATCLQTALRLARQHRWVSEWLFKTPWKPFHPGLILPPSSLDAGIAWRLGRTIRPHLLDSAELSTELDCFLMPVAYVGGIVVGYTLGADTGKPVNADFFHHDNPLDVPFRGRFAYDTRAKEMLHIVQKRVDGSVGVHFLRLNAWGALDHCSFVVPCGEYHFKCLPSECIVMFYGAEYKVERMGEKEVKECDDTSLAVTDQLLPPVGRRERVDELVSVEHGSMSYLPWIMGMDGLADGGSLGFTPMQMDTSSGAFCYDRLLQCTAAFGRACYGRYYVPTMRMDVSQGGAGLCSMYTGKGFSDFRQLEMREFDRVKRSFAENYFVAVLGVTIDQPLLPEGWSDENATSAGGRESGEELFELGNEKVDVGSWTERHAWQIPANRELQVAGAHLGEFMKRTDTGKRALRRTAAPIEPARNLACALEQSVTPPNESKNERKARLAAERRQRNRVSAAKSNARNKEKAEAMEREISENLETVKKLQERKVTLTEENKRLQEMVAVRNGG